MKHLFEVIEKGPKDFRIYNYTDSVWVTIVEKGATKGKAISFSTKEEAERMISLLNTMDTDKIIQMPQYLN